MKSSIFLLSAASSLLVSAAPLASDLTARATVDDTVDDMLNVIVGKKKCSTSNVACIFARGTFDSGNRGVWVGPQFMDPLAASIPGIDLQGVDPYTYKASLAEYLQDEGSNAGAASLAKTIDAYAAACPNSAIIVSGWSQGALVVRKGLEKVSPAGIKHVKAVVVFGDPNQRFTDHPIPASIPSTSVFSPCVTGSDPDLLCAKLPGDFKFPTSINDIVETFSHLPEIETGLQQTQAAASLIKGFPAAILGTWKNFILSLTPSKFMRLMLTPQHFAYGNNPAYAKAVAAKVAALPAIKGAKSAVGAGVAAVKPLGAATATSKALHAAATPKTVATANKPLAKTLAKPVAE